MRLSSEYKMPLSSAPSYLTTCSIPPHYLFHPTSLPVPSYLTTCSILPHYLFHPTSLPVPSCITDSPLKETPSKPTPQPHSPRTVTQEQRHPSPATHRQGYGSPVMPHVTLAELKSSKPLNRRTHTSSPGM